ncbi:hypothetical protein [Microbacterium sp. GCS4]|uniref:hypothetical protein n=1 Tax=Microbacterium sp. GCS4 TaxID=1692239 RepID=UPI0006818868|nr:hypothetical protein [Microbacterium sp. GCS4]KNY06052.1 hypothetical protein AKH00_09565 [Microbacterium sp. GCS4]
MRTPTNRLSPRGIERMLIVRVALALGLALLLVIGAWSTSHRTADAHSALCLATGVSASSTGVSASSTGSGHDLTEAASSPIEASPMDAGGVVIAVLCCLLLVLLLLRLPGRSALLCTDSPRRSVMPSRAGPRRAVPALTLVQLSLSRT